MSEKQADEVEQAVISKLRWRAIEEKDNEAASILLAHCAAVKQLERQFAFAADQMTKALPRIGGGETTQEYSARLKALGLDD